MYDRKAIRRRRGVLAAFVVASIVLITVYFGESVGGGLHAIQRGAQAVLSPVEKGASRVFSPVRNLAGWVGDVVHAKGQNKQLKAEVARLRTSLAEAQTGERDAAQLGGISKLTEARGFPRDTQPVTARVIARSPTLWYSAVRIDKGSSDGVRVDQPVITADGLAGKVTSVTGGTATVELVTDQGSSVSAQVMPDGANGIVQPKVGDANDLLLNFVQKGRPVKEGQTVVTSGFTSSNLESLFPRGIPIGKVRRVDPNELQTYQTVHIRPFADLRRMDFVQVLTNGRPGQRAQAGTAAGGP